MYFSQFVHAARGALQSRPSGGQVSLVCTPVFPISHIPIFPHVTFAFSPIYHIPICPYVTFPFSLHVSARSASSERGLGSSRACSQRRTTRLDGCSPPTAACTRSPISVPTCSLPPKAPDRGTLVLLESLLLGGALLLGGCLLLGGGLLLGGLLSGRPKWKSPIWSGGPIQKLVIVLIVRKLLIVLIVLRLNRRRCRLHSSVPLIW